MYYNVVYIQSCRSKNLLGYKMVTEVEAHLVLNMELICLYERVSGAWCTACTTM